MSEHAYRAVLVVAAVVDIVIVTTKPTHLTFALLTAAFAVKSAVATVVYWRGSPWWRTAIGRALLALTGSGCVAAAALAAFMFGVRFPYDVRVDGALTAIAAFMFLRFLLALLRAQQEGRSR